MLCCNIRSQINQGRLLRGLELTNNLLGDEYTAWQKKVKAYGAMFKMTALIVKSAKK